MAKNSFRVKKGTITLEPVSTFPLDAEIGDICVLDSDGMTYRFDGANWQQFIDEDTPQTLTNKTISADSLTVGEMYGTSSDDNSTGSLVTIPAVSTYILKLSDAGLVSVSGITAPMPDGNRFFVLTNDLATSVDIFNDDAGASATDRILTGTGGKIRLRPDASLWLYYDTENEDKWRVVGGSGSGEGGAVKARLHSATLTTLPTGTGLIIDGVTVNALDLVLFTALSSGANKVYEAQGTGTAITSWVAQDLFNLTQDPVSGDLVVIQEGEGFAGRLGTFRTSLWSFNDNVRYFNGPDYWEQSSLNTVTLADNQAAPADVFTVGAMGSENMVVEFSILRSSVKEIGTVLISHNGTTLNYAKYGNDISYTGVTLTADLDSGNVRLRYTSTSTGSTATIKYLVKRWSDAPGGPGNLASYSVGSSSVTGSGAANRIGIWDTANNISSSADLEFDSVAGVLSMGSASLEMERTVLDSITLVDNTSSQPVFQVPFATYQYLIVDYSIERGSDRSVGSLYITTDGSLTSIAPVFTDLGTPGVTFAVDINGVNVRLLANTTSTGSSALLKFAMKRWG